MEMALSLEESESMFFSRRPQSYEGTFPSVTRLSIRELCRFVALDESSRSLEEFVPIRGSTRVINFLLPFQPGMS